MIATLRRHISNNLVAYLALFVALGGTSYAAVKVTSQQIANNTVRSVDIRNNSVLGKDIRNRTVKGVDIGRGTLGGEHFQGGALPAGPQGAPGAPGADGAAGPRGPSFGDSFHVRNVNDLECGTENVLASHEVTVPEASRIWVYAQGVVRPGPAELSQVGLWAQFTTPGATEPVASSIVAWETTDTPDEVDEVVPLVSGGAMFSGLNTEPAPDAAPHVVPPGTYLFELVVRPSGDCTGGQPDFGFNQGNVMGYMLLGAG